MGIEIERKFLLANTKWRQYVKRTSHIVQAYLNRADYFSMRVRLQSRPGASHSINLLEVHDPERVEANLNIKTAELGVSRHEYTYEIPITDALEIFSLTPWRISKKRHFIEIDGLTWEIDEFLDANKGLVIAEVELNASDQAIDYPEWLGREVSADQRYYNNSLAMRPYADWVSHIEVDSSKQILTAFNPNHDVVQSYAISTAKKGLGEEKNSFQTPRGLHMIRAKIGQNAAADTVFSGRRETGEIFTDALSRQEPDRDWILSRILWLSGLEPGKNRLGDVDTMQRYIYIHGAPDMQVEPIGEAHSHGCIRMRSDDVIQLFAGCFVGTTVMIF